MDTSDNKEKTEICEYADGISQVGFNYNLPGAELIYYQNFMSPELANFYFETFMQLPFVQGRVRGGVENRLSCFYSELVVGSELKSYEYSGKINPSLPFTDEMLFLKKSIEYVTGTTYNSCLVNLYISGKSTIGFHSDSEKSLKKYSTIASISLGAERWFDVVNKEDGPYATGYATDMSIRTKHGSLITMGGAMQTHYKHRLRAEAKVKNPRINLTFRQAI